MKIKKELKHARFIWDEDSKTFTIEQPPGNRIELDKVYSFALMRFIIRIAQRNFLKKPQANKSKSTESTEVQHGDANQQNFNF